MSDTSKNNKSLFLYTALIFIVAIILIILAFFGQENVKSNQPVLATIEPSKQLTMSISERASLLSDENAALLKENQEYKEKNEALLKEIDIYKEKNDINEQLLLAYSLILKEDKQGAADILLKLDVQKLDENQKALYDRINELAQ